MDTKHPLKSITLTRAEGTVAECGKPATLPSWELADAVLARWASTVTPRCYHKVDFVVEWEGDESYAGTFDLKCEHTGGTSMLRDHALANLGMLAGVKPPRMPLPLWDVFCQRNSHLRDGAKRLLAVLDFGG